MKMSERNNKGLNNDYDLITSIVESKINPYKPSKNR